MFELKKGGVKRDAVTQAIDYASSLEAMSDSDLFRHIATQSGGESGIEPIENFGDWYDELFSDRDSLRPVHMILVGLGVDDDATRMVEFLAGHDVPMSIMTFHGYNHGGSSFFAKQVQTERDVKERVKVKSTLEREREKEAKEAKQRALEERVAGIQDLWEDVVSTFDNGCRTKIVLKNGFNFYWDSLNLREHDTSFNIPTSVRLTDEGKVRVIFFPVSISLCSQDFNDSKRNIGFKEEQPVRAPRTNEIDMQWFRDLDEEEWKTHKEELAKLVDAVGKAWREAQREWRESRRRQSSS